MTLATWFAFLLTAIAIAFSPGPAVVFSLSNGVNYGFRRGHVAVYGLALGVGTLTCIASIGVGALLLASPAAFGVVKGLGIAYLAYLGLKQLFAREATLIDGEARGGDASPRTLILKGWLLNSTNPKGIVFLMAFIPPFVDPSRPALPQYLIITLTLMATELFAMTVYTGCAARLLARLRGPRQMRLLNRLFGLLFLAAAGFLAAFNLQQ